MQRHTLTRASVWMVAFLAFAAAVSAERLPGSAEKLLIRKTQAAIVGVSAVRERTIGDFDYLGVEAAFEITWSFESLDLSLHRSPEAPFGSRLVARGAVHLWWHEDSTVIRNARRRVFKLFEAMEDLTSRCSRRLAGLFPPVSHD